MASPLMKNAESVRSLVSWKEIAAFLNRGERTVKRWERERGLPVHRVPGGERGSVFAYPDELNAWLLTDQGKSDENSLPLDQNRNGWDEAQPVIAAQPLYEDQALRATGIRVAANQDQTARRYRTWRTWATLSAAALAVAAASVYTLRGNTKTTVTGARSNSSSGGTSHAPSPLAEHFYLQGRYEWSLRTADSLVKSIDDYTQAIVQDSNYASAYAGLAESYDILPEFGRLSREEAFPRAKAAADKAIALEPNLAAAHRAKAFALFYGDWDVPASDAEFKLALALAPDEMQTHHWYATTLFSRLDAAHAIAEIDQAERLSPTTAAVVADAAFIHAFFHQDRQANLHILREMGQTQPKLASSFRYLAEIDLQDENYPEYLADLRHSAEISHDPFEESLASAANAGWTRAGKTGLLEGVREVQQKAFDHGDESGYWLGRTYLMLDQPTQALRYFNQSLQKNDFALMTLAACPCIAGLKENPGYSDLLRRVHQRMYPQAAVRANTSASLESEAIPLLQTKRP